MIKCLLLLLFPVPQARLQQPEEHPGLGDPAGEAADHPGEVDGGGHAGAHPPATLSRTREQNEPDPGND